MVEAPRKDNIYVAVSEHDAFVRVVGRGSFKVSPSLKDFCSQVVNEQRNRVIIDMHDALSMDSTFMGVLAGQACRVRPLGGFVALIRLNSHARALLATLGIDTLVQAYEEGDEPPELGFDANYSEVSGEDDQLHMATTILDAHETLVELIPENRPKFKDVLTFLRKDVADAERKR